MVKYFFVVVLFISIQGQAQERIVECSKDVKFDEIISVNTSPSESIDLVLNGVGKKRVLFFNVAFGAFYLENQSQDAEAILASDEIKVGIIHTLMGASQSMMVGMWNDEFDRLCHSRCEELRPYHEKFLSYVRDLEKNERLYLMIFKDRFEFEANNNEFYDPIYSSGYANLIQRVLIGPEASDKKLEKALLGIDKVCKGT